MPNCNFFQLTGPGFHRAQQERLWHSAHEAAASERRLPHRPDETRRATLQGSPERRDGREASRTRLLQRRQPGTRFTALKDITKIT